MQLRPLALDLELIYAIKIKTFRLISSTAKLWQLRVFRLTRLKNFNMN